MAEPTPRCPSVAVRHGWVEVPHRGTDNVLDTSVSAVPPSNRLKSSNAIPDQNFPLALPCSLGMTFSDKLTDPTTCPALVYAPALCVFEIAKRDARRDICLHVLSRLVDARFSTAAIQLPRQLSRFSRAKRPIRDCADRRRNSMSQKGSKR